MKYVLICDGTVDKCILVDGVMRMELDANPYTVAELLGLSAVDAKTLKYLMEA